MTTSSNKDKGEKKIIWKVNLVVACFEDGKKIAEIVVKKNLKPHDWKLVELLTELNI